MFRVDRLFYLIRCIGFIGSFTADSELSRAEALSNFYASLFKLRLTIP
jgi:hypothetical protein